MFCRIHVCVLLLAAAILFASASPTGCAQARQLPQPQTQTTIRLHWGPQTGVARYRLQLAQDREFTDIVFDRVVVGTEIVINDLLPGHYFWRIAPLTTTLGTFSSIAPIEVSGPQISETKTAPDKSANRVIAADGWRAAVGAVSHPVVAHLQSPNTFDVVGTNAQGVAFALDALTGVARWTVPLRAPANSAGGHATTPLIVSSPAGRDNVVIVAGQLIIEIEGASGRELWRSTLPAPAVAAAVMHDQNRAQIVILDQSHQRLFIINEGDGRLLSQVKLTSRAFDAPLAFAGHGRQEILIAYENGDIDIRDGAGNVLRSGAAGSPITTAPVLVHGSSGDLVLVGTRDGLTALTGNELRPLGRVALKDDAPRGTLLTEDLNGDGVAEVIMTTLRGHIVAVNATDGKIVWDVAALDNDVSAFALADVNGDGTRDVLMATNQSFAVARSGRDGSLLWKDSEPVTSVANHVSSFEPRTLLAVPAARGTLIIGPDPAQTGLRAILFTNR